MLLGSRIVSTFADVTKNQLKDEKELVKILSEKDALECLKEGMHKPPSEQEITIKRAIAKLPKFLQNSEDADAMLRKFAAAFGWQLPKPQPVAVPPPVAQQPQQQSTQLQTVQPQPTQNIVLPNTSVLSDFANSFNSMFRQLSSGDSVEVKTALRSYINQLEDLYNNL